MNSPLRLNAQLRSITIGLLFACSGLGPLAHAVFPPPDGGYANFTTAEGTNALKNLSTGAGNSAVGWFSLFTDSTASFNTAVGAATLLFNNGARNTAVGAAGLLNNASGEDNTALGAFALLNNDGNANTAAGAGALFSNTTGDQNTAQGVDALHNNNVGDSNTAAGFRALFTNDAGFRNSAFGSNALASNASGQRNTAVGYNALGANTASSSTALGADALASNVGGLGNTAVGDGALANIVEGGPNTAVGFQALVNAIGDNNIALGAGAGINLNTGSNNIYIGHEGVNGQNNSINIGTAGIHNGVFINGIFGATTVSGIPVYIDGSSKLGTMTSSQRFKEAIKPMGKTSESLYALKPVTFRYKKQIDPVGVSQLGLVAEDVEKVNSNLVVCDAEGKPYAVRYDAVNAMLLNEFLKEHHQVQDLKVTVAEQQKQIEALTAGLQKVNAHLELNKLAPQTVQNNR